jgi:hypothetical protein
MATQSWRWFSSWQTLQREALCSDKQAVELTELHIVLALVVLGRTWSPFKKFACICNLRKAMAVSLLYTTVASRNG